MNTVLVAVDHDAREFAVTARSSDQLLKIEGLKRKLTARGFDVTTYAVGLTTAQARDVRDGHKYMYGEIGYAQVSLS